ncbi:MAG: helix-turn-helix domain-containing protein [Patescibacteria group bacterium]|nr:helix-turn-helix domain-containing protein [Patescibacteria group bacterium]
MEIETKNLSTLLIETLRTKSLTIEKLGVMTGISERFLNLLIEENFKKLPAAPYVHGYILKIAEVLNMDGEKLWQEYLKDHNSINRSGEKDKLPQNRFVTKSLNKKTVIIAIIIILILIYVIVRLPAILGKPPLALAEIANNTIVTEENYQITGEINPGDKLTINSEIVFADEEGKFQKTIKLNPGFNTFEFKVKNILGRETALTKQVFYKILEANILNNVIN